MTKPILVLDFDGTVAQYTSGWQGATVIPDPPVEGLWDFLREACEVFDVQVYSSRSHQDGGIEAMMNWFLKHAPYKGMAFIDVSFIYWADIAVSISFPVVKPPAMMTLDDRGLLFTGVWPDVKALQNFRPWYKQ